MSAIGVIDPALLERDVARVSSAGNFPEVDRRSKLSLGAFRREYLLPQRPVVITDAMDAWPARTKWTFDFFRRTLGAEPIKIYRYDAVREFVKDAVETVPFADYIDHVVAEDWETYPYYLRDNWSLLHDHPELKTDYSEPQYFFDWFRLLPAALRMPYPRLFLGPRGATTPLHVDVWRTHAWLSQLVGRKRWILFPPDQEALHYASKVRVDAPDLVKYPNYRQVKPVEATIGPGDTIFVPSGWAHWVRSLDATISLTGNYMSYGCFGSCASKLTADVSRRLTAKVRGG